ncbi:MAG: phytanoyl-CoA dioxygenase family protein [Verrucomicrobiota bacterium]
MASDSSHGFEIHRSVFKADEIGWMREEAENLQTKTGSTCIRQLCRRSSRFDDLANDSRLLSLLPSDFQPVRSILFDKNHKENWPVAWHQDLTISVRRRHHVDGYGPWSVKEGVAHVQPPIEVLERLSTLRIHIDDTSASNGALKVVPNTHALGRLNATQIQVEVASGSTTCICGPGDVLQMSPLILHSSSRSEKPAHRRVVHIEYAPPDALPHPLSFYES